jgi:copper chaperone
MKTELKIEGMSCGHCVLAVQGALESVPGVTAATVSLEEGRAVVESDGANEERLIEAVKEEGYHAKRA